MMTMRKGTMRRRARGYTAVEVLMAMTLLAIGATAVMSMQRSSIQGNADARKLDVANSIAREWLERLRRDAALWTQPGPANARAPSNYTSSSCPNPMCNSWPLLLSTYLPLPASGTVSPTAITNWSFPDVYLQANPSVPDGVSVGFDILGRDLAETDLGKAVFCVNIRLNWLVTPTDAAGNGRGGLIRAEVRVFWPRQLGAAPSSDWCSSTNSAGGGDKVTGDTNTYHFVYAASAIRQNPAQ
jgi:type IV pilus assembly protein PilV